MCIEMKSSHYLCIYVVLAGGQVEINALCSVLQRRIWIYGADASMPILKMGEDCAQNTGVIDVPIRVSFHRHYYTLGEHYNSVV